MQEMESFTVRYSLRNIQVEGILKQPVQKSSQTHFAEIGEADGLQ